VAYSVVKRLLIGRPLSSREFEQQRLPKRLALGVFSTDAIASTAFATQEILVVLVPAAGMAALGYLVPISLLVVALLVIVVLSYRQTLYAYPNGGGSYIVSRENLGTNPSLVAAASLLVDYTLTVSVSVAAGVAAITSAIAPLRGHEVELAMVIGRTAKGLSGESALDAVFGWTILNDVSARDLQSRHKQFFKGKSLDGYCPMGPWIVTADEIPDPQQLTVRLRVNGVTKQESNTSLMLFSVRAIIAILSQGLTLEPGDIIATGTPSGVGFARNPPEFLKAGDIMETEIEGIGTMRNPVVNA